MTVSSEAVLERSVSPHHPLGSTGQEFELRANRLIRRVAIEGCVTESWRPRSQHGERTSKEDPLATWWGAYLSGCAPRSSASPAKPLRIADLFCGSGGLALGVGQLANELGRSIVWDLVVDSDPGAVATFAANHDVRVRDTRSVTSLIDYRVRGFADRSAFAYEPELLDEEILAALSGLDLLTAGPPCQGHSTLNNRSRGRDRRNQLMLCVAAFAAAANVPRVIIENVPSAVRDAASVVATVRTLLRSRGYRMTEGVLAADEMGWPQTRRRFFLVACREERPLSLSTVRRALADSNPERRERSVSWLLSQIPNCQGTAEVMDPLDMPTMHSEENQARIDWLFDNDAYDLPEARRPLCHRDGTTYGAVYGRIRPDQPAPTITTGFTSPGRGRFVHPTKRRAITPREASVIQGFPLGYRFVTVGGGTPSRTQLAKWIGDAVPMPLGYAAALSALGSIRTTGQLVDCASSDGSHRGL